ncbi:MAG: superoxide dismutase family protein [Clostridia bacterium]|nr:superoxide dismutase family protein [Clostridia bacterium]
MNFSEKKPEATAIIEGGDNNPKLHGEVSFYECQKGVIVVALIRGLPADNKSGFFAFHIHEGDTCSGKDFADTLSHYNPNKQPHPNHAGDLPPLLSCKGTAWLCVLTDRFSIKEIIGKTVIIHNSPDDFVTQPSGNAGAKIACGVINRG